MNINHPVVQFLSLFSHGDENELFFELLQKSLFFFFFKWACLLGHPSFLSLIKGVAWLLGIAFQLASVLPYYKVCRKTEMVSQPGFTYCVVLQFLTEYLKTRDLLSYHSHEVFIQSSPTFITADKFRIFMRLWHSNSIHRGKSIILIE